MSGVLGGTDQGFAWRVSAFFAALFLVYGTSLPYLPVWLDASGLTPSQIGIVSSVPLMLRLVLTPLIAVHADRRNDHRGVIIALAALGCAAVAVLPVVGGFWPILIVATALLVCIQSIMPLIETVAMAGVKRAGHDYGRMRLWGSVTFIIVTFVGAGLIDRLGSSVVIWLLGCGAVLTLVAAVLLPRPLIWQGPSLDAALKTPARLDFAAARTLLTSRSVLLFLIAAGAVQSAHAVFYAFGVLHWRTSNIPGAWIGILWSVGVLAEIALFWWSAKVLVRWTAVDLIIVGTGAAVLRWTLMAFDPPLAMLFPLQVLHGLTYGASHLGAMHFIQGHVPDGQAGTAQALYSTVTAGIGMGLALLFAGAAYQRYGGFSYFGMALLSAAGLAAALALRRTIPTNPRALARSSHR
jgi:MFS transporter, PPP family, 3-phenylpropionic acid transporter